MEYCNYNFGKKQRLKNINSISFLHCKVSEIDSVLYELKTEADRILNSVGEVINKAETNYNYYSKCEQLVRVKIEEVNAKINNTPKQLSCQVFVEHSNGEGEWVTQHYPNPEISELEKCREELEDNESYLKSLLEKLNSIIEKYSRIDEIYSDYSSKITNAQSAIKSIENQASENLQEVDKCIDSAAQAIHQCLSIRMDRSYGVKTYIKKIVID